MAKPKDDSRDVFDKALDYAPEIGGAVAGGALLRRFGRRVMKKGPHQTVERPKKGETFGGLDYGPGAIIMRPSTAAEVRAQIRNAGRVGVVVGALGGGGVGAGASYATDYRKRRKK